MIIAVVWKENETAVPAPTRLCCLWDGEHRLRAGLSDSPPRFRRRCVPRHRSAAGPGSFAAALIAAVSRIITESEPKLTLLVGKRVRPLGKRLSCERAKEDMEGG